MFKAEQVEAEARELVAELMAVKGKADGGVHRPDRFENEYDRREGRVAKITCGAEWIYD